MILSSSNKSFTNLWKASGVLPLIIWLTQISNWCSILTLPMQHIPCFKIANLWNDRLCNIPIKEPFTYCTYFTTIHKKYFPMLEFSFISSLSTPFFILKTATDIVSINFKLSIIYNLKIVGEGPPHPKCSRVNWMV